MSHLQQSESLVPHLNLSRSEPLSQKLPILLSKVGLEMARIRGSIGPISPDEINISVKGEGHYLITPSKLGAKHIEKFGFKTFSRAVELAMIPQKWGIVTRIYPETHSIELFVPSTASKRQ